MGKAVRKCSIALIAGMAIGAMVFCGSSIGCHMLSGGRVYAAEKGTDSRGYAEKPEHYIPLHIPLDDYSVSFRRGISLQMDMLVKAVETGDASIYQPIEIR